MSTQNSVSRQSWRHAVAALVVMLFAGNAAFAVLPHLRIEVANGDDVWGRYVWAQQGDRVKVRVIAERGDVAAYGLSGVLYNVFTQGTQDGDDIVVNPEFAGNRVAPFNFGFQRPKIKREVGKLTLGVEGASVPDTFGKISSAQKPPATSGNYNTSLQAVILQFEMTIGNSKLRSFNIDASIAALDKDGNQFAFHADAGATRSDVFSPAGVTEYAMVIIPSPGAAGLLALGGIVASRRRGR